MNKVETVQRLSDSAPTPERLQATMELQKQISMLTDQATALGQTLTKWATGSFNLYRAQRQQMLDLAVLIEPIAPALESIRQRQQAQDERLAKLEQAMVTILSALPSPAPGRPQPRLAASVEVQALPAKVVAELPKPMLSSLFGKS